MPTKASFSLSLSLSSDAAFTNAFFLNDKFTENTIKVFTKETCFVVVHFIFHEEKKRWNKSSMICEDWGEIGK